MSHANRNKEHFVYKIIDPDTDEPFYVGITVNIGRRIRNHLGDRALPRVAKMLANNKLPRFEIIERQPNLKEAEQAETRAYDSLTKANFQLDQSRPGNEKWRRT